MYGAAATADLTRALEILLCLLLLTGVSVLAVAYYQLYFMWLYVRDKSTSDRTVMLYWKVFLMINVFSDAALTQMPIPSSLQFILAHGGNYGISGLYVSLPGAVFPIVIAYRLVPFFRQLGYSPSVKITTVADLICNCLTVVIATRGPFFGSLCCILLIRFFMGQTFGLRRLNYLEYAVGALPSRGLATWAFRYSIVLSTGSCFGPFMGSTSISVMKLILDGRELNPGAACEIVMVSWRLITLPVYLALLPRELHRAGIDTFDKLKSIRWTVPERTRRLNVLTVALAICIKHSVLLTVESFDVLVMEIDYGFSSSESGYFVSAALISSIPVMVSITLFEGSIPKNVMTCLRRSGCIIAFLLSFCTYPYCPFSSAYCLAIQWVSRVLFYATQSISGSWLGACIQMWVMPNTNHWWSQKNWAFKWTLMENLSVFLAPFIVRSLYEYHGRLASCIFISICEGAFAALIWFGLVIPWGKYYK